MKIKIYHGSVDIIKKPQYGYGKTYNDYGQGFYCTETKELAKEWACSDNNTNGYSNEYSLNLDGLQVLNLSDEKYHILNWLAILLDNRILGKNTQILKTSEEYLLKNFLPDYKEYDVIVGYRADDSYFTFAKAFLTNQISLEQLSKAMYLGKLGEQVVLKSKKAFNQIEFIDFEIAESNKYHPLRSKRANKAKKEFKEINESADINGTYIIDIIREGWKNDDARLYRIING